MSTQTARIGRTVAVEIPEELLNQANLSVGDAVEWTLLPNGALALHPLGTSSDYESWKTGEIQAGFSEIEAGETVPHDKVTDWLRSWGTASELPPPL